MALALCVALHVTDEALTGFLEVYNPIARALRARLPFLPVPVFTFRVWLAGLVAGIILWLALSVFAFRGARWTVPLAMVFGTLMLFNGLSHIGGSIYMGRLMPGVYSAPLLLAGSLYLWIAASRYRASLTAGGKAHPS